MYPPNAPAELGLAEVFVSGPEGHPLEFWARRATDRIMAVSATAPQPIRDQAEAFRDHIERVILHYMTEARRSDRAAQAKLRGD